MEPFDSSVYGAKIQSFRQASPRDLLRRLLEEEPSSSKAQLLTMCSNEIRKDEDMVDAVIEYWFSNNYHSLVGRLDTRIESRTANKHVVERARAKIVEKIEERAQMILLDMILPNGKALKDCTGRECANLGNKISPWLAKIAKAIKPNERVGDVLSEGKIREFYGS